MILIGFLEINFPQCNSVKWCYSVSACLAYFVNATWILCMWCYGWRQLNLLSWMLYSQGWKNVGLLKKN